MTTVAVVAAVLLGSAFVVAGATKLSDRGAWEQQSAGLGAPRWSVPIVPWLELALGALLIVQIGRRAVAVIAIGLLVVFSAAIARKLAAGERPPCACFGAWSSRPIGSGHLVRNGVLAGLAVLAASA